MGTKSARVFILTLAAVSSVVGVRAQAATDPLLNLLVYSSPISGPSGAVFVGKNQALVTQKNDGKVLFFENGELSAKVLDLSVANRGAQGLVDIALSPKFSRDGFVYLYHTPAKKDGALSDSKVISRYHWDKKTETLSFDRVVSTVDKAPKATSLSGMISFDSKGRVSIAPVSTAGPNVATADFTLNKTTSTLRVFRPLDSLSGKSIVGLVPSYVINKAGGGTLSLLPQATPFTTQNTKLAGSLSTTISASIPVKRGAAFASGPLNTLSLNNSPTINIGVGSIQILKPVIPPRPIGISTLNLGNLTGGTLTLNPISPVFGGGTLINNGVVNASGTIVVNQGTLITGLIISNGASVNGAYNHGAGTIAPGEFSTPGAITINAIPITGGMLTFDVADRIWHLNGGTNDLTIVNGDVSFSPGTIVRYVGSGTDLSVGTLVYTGIKTGWGDGTNSASGAAQSTFRSTFSLRDLGNAIVSGAGTLNTESGTIELAGGTFRPNMGTISSSSGTLLSGFGTLITGSGTISTRTLELPAATIDLSGGIVEMTSGTLTFPAVVDPLLVDPAAPVGPAMPTEPVVVPTSLSIVNTPEPGILSLGIASFLGAMLHRRRRIQRTV